MKFIKFLKIVFILSLTILTLFGCQYKEESLRKTDYTKYEYETKKEEIDTDVQNIKYYASKASLQTKDNSNNGQKEDFVKEDDVIDLKNEDGSHSIINYKELAEMVSQKLKYEFKDYRMKEHLIFNYTNISELQLNGVYLDETVDTVRKADQYYRDSQRTVGQNSFNRNVTAIKYKDKANLEVQKGTFYTREKKKPVQLEWEGIEYKEDSKDIVDFVGVKELDFLNVNRFYYYNNDLDFKGRGKATLRDFLTWNTVDNTGIKTLKDNKVRITREFIEKGVTTEKTLEIDPLKASFEFDIKVSQDEDDNLVIDIEADLTDALKVYYAVYEQYDIINSNYTLNIIKYPIIDETTISTSSEASKLPEMEEDNKEYGWFTDSQGNYKYRDKNGKILRNTTTPDGFRVDRNGVWIQD